jgi:hypothetical protein
MVNDAKVHYDQSSLTDGTLLSGFGELNWNADVIAFPEQKRPEYEVADPEPTFKPACLSAVVGIPLGMTQCFAALCISQ